MSPSNVQGLDIVQPDQHSSNSHDLLSQVYPDLAAQIALWKSFIFNSDEANFPRHETHENAAKSLTEEESRSPVSGEKAVHDGYVNVTPPSDPVIPNSNNSVAVQSASLFDIDINSLLNALGVDAFTAHTSQLQQQPTTIIPSLAQLLVLLPFYFPAFRVGLPGHTVNAAAPLPFTHPTSIPSQDPNVPTAQRVRTRRVSVTRTESPNSRKGGLPPNLNLSPAEDKRRRNTAASARFRLRKKEREAALEGNVKVLETKVNELEREFEDLRRENGWLKGLVGVTGSAQGPTSTGLTISSLPLFTTTTTESNR